VLTETATEAPGRAGDVAVRLLPRAGANVVTFVLGFDAGSRTESAHEHGCAHLLEHLVFRGSEAHPSADAVAAAAEEQGMQIGAHTMHDVVLFHATAPSWSVDAMVDLLCDVVARPLLRDADVEASQLKDDRSSRPARRTRRRSPRAGAAGSRGSGDRAG